METDAHSGTRAFDLASLAVAIIGLNQGVLPLVLGLLFDERGPSGFALVRRLPSPWWWIAGLGVTLTAGVLLVVIDGAKQRRLRGLGETPGVAMPLSAEPASTPEQTDTTQPAKNGYDTAITIVGLLGLYNGVAPFVARWFFDGNLLLSLPLRLPSPWWWIVSLAVLVVTFLLLVSLDAAKRRHAGA